MLLVERASGTSSGRGALPTAKNLILKVEASCHRVSLRGCGQRTEGNPAACRLELLSGGS